ncbi:MAG: hypothetical protein Ta2B_12400 [Termitinemataceae bacterium]|nr:MAG: hypothetical protein Ta2B_12400 [Termitinemataceae bacterium]
MFALLPLSVVPFGPALFAFKLQQNSMQSCVPLVFRGAFKNPKDFWQTFLYIDGNAVEAKLVKSPLDWIFGGAWFHQNGKMPIVEVPEWGSVRDMAPYHLPAG